MEGCTRQAIHAQGKSLSTPVVHMIIYDRTAKLDTKKTGIIGLKVAHTNAWRIRFLTIHSRLAVNSEKTLIVYFHQLFIDMYCLRLQSLQL